MTDPSPYAAPGAVPPGAVPTAPVARTTTMVRPVAIAIVAAAAVLAVVNGVYAGRFPPGAVVEPIWAFGISVDLVAVALAVLVRLLVVARRPVVPARAGLSVWGPLAAGFAVIALAGWLLTGGAEYWTQGMQRYLSASTGIFFFGIPWVLALVFGEIALRRGDTALNRALAIGALVVGTIIGVAGVAAAVIYGSGLSD